MVRSGKPRVGTVLGCLLVAAFLSGCARYSLFYRIPQHTYRVGLLLVQGDVAKAEFAAGIVEATPVYIAGDAPLTHFVNGAVYVTRLGEHPYPPNATFLAFNKGFYDPGEVFFRALEERLTAVASEKRVTAVPVYEDISQLYLHNSSVGNLVKEIGRRHSLDGVWVVVYQVREGLEYSWFSENTVKDTTFVYEHKVRRGGLLGQIYFLFVDLTGRSPTASLGNKGVFLEGTQEKSRGDLENEMVDRFVQAFRKAIVS